MTRQTLSADNLGGIEHFYDSRYLAWQTLLVWLGCIVALVALMSWHDLLPVTLVVIVGGFLIALYGSLQHEAIHGMLAQGELSNRLLVSLPLTLWLPFQCYRMDHIAHHRCDRLTDPLKDPESYFLVGSGPTVFRRMYLINQTLAGRLVFGPWISAISYWLHEIRRVREGDSSRLSIWVRHVLGTLVLLWLLQQVFGLSPLEFLLMFAWPGMSLTLLRSFAEHQPHANEMLTTTIVEAGPITSLLFLNNNLHWLHHRHPDLRWYQLPSLYRARQLDLRDRGIRIRSGYGELVRDNLFRPLYPAVHPQYVTRQTDI